MVRQIFCRGTKLSVVRRKLLLLSEEMGWSRERCRETKSAVKLRVESVDRELLRLPKKYGSKSMYVGGLEDVGGVFVVSANAAANAGLGVWCGRLREEEARCWVKVNGEPKSALWKTTIVTLAM